MEQHRKYTIMLTEDGLFEKAKRIANGPIGVESIYEPLMERKGTILSRSIMNKKPVRILAMACILMLLVFPILFIVDNEKTYAYVNIDINPSMELEVDKDMKVHAIHPLNEDASLLLDELEEVKGKKLETIITIIMQKSESKGLIKHGKNMVVGINYVQADKISNPNAIDQYFTAVDNEWNIVTLNIPEEVRETAKAEQKSMNEIMAAKLIGNDDGLNGVTKETIAVNDEEKAIIKSFYMKKNEANDPNTDKTDKQINKKPVKEKKDVTVKEKQQNKPAEQSKVHQTEKETNRKKQENAEKSNQHAKEEQKIKKDINKYISEEKQEWLEKKLEKKREKFRETEEDYRERKDYNDYKKYFDEDDDENDDEDED